MKTKDYPTLDQRIADHKIKYPSGTPDRCRQNTWWYKFIMRPCKHKWQPISFVFETQMLDDRGRVQIRQPDINDGRVYCVCMKCLSHTYVITGWAGFFIGSPDLLEDYDKKEKGLIKTEDDE